MKVFSHDDKTEYVLYFDRAEKGQVIMTWDKERSWAGLDEITRMLFRDIDKYKASKVILRIDSNTECEFLIKRVFELPYR